MIMPVSLLFKAFTIWFVILLLAIFNGLFRESVLVPELGSTSGFVVSGLLLSAVIIIVAYISLPWLGSTRATQLLAIGFGWLALTLIFEFSFGLAQGKSWQLLLEAYTFKNGNIWPVVLFTTTIAPYVAGKLRHRV